MLPSAEDEIGSLEHARNTLYNPVSPARERTTLAVARERSLPHVWREEGKAPPPPPPSPHRRRRSLRFATFFAGGAAAFFVVSLLVAGYVFKFGGNAVSVDKITLSIQGPTTIAGGDTVPLSLTITNKNPVAIKNAIVEIDFPAGTRSAKNVLNAYPRYVENLGTLESGATVTRSIKAVVFGGAGQALTLPVSFSYGTDNSNATFEKKSSYTLALSSTPLSVSVEALTEAVSDKPLSLTLTVRSNASVPLNNVVVNAALPFGFLVNSSSLPLTNSSFFVGTLAPGASKQITLTGTLSGQRGEQRVFRFTVGTAKSSLDQSLLISYMTQEATVSLAEPFITTSLALNNDTSDGLTLSPASSQTVSLTYTNKLPITVSHVTVVVTVAGSGVDYDSIKSMNGFYNSADHTIVFSEDTDSGLAALAPGASGVGTFTFSTLPPGALSPNVTFSIAVSGVRTGQSNVPEQVAASITKTVKVATEVRLSARSSHSSGPFVASGPVPPRAEQATTYTVEWRVQNLGSTVAGGVVTAGLPTYVTYTGQTTGAGAFTYDDVTRKVTWNVGELAQGAGAQRLFQVSLTPSTSQKDKSPALTAGVSFSGHDRFAGVSVTASAEAVTTETFGDPGYVSGSGIVR